MSGRPPSPLRDPLVRRVAALLGYGRYARRRLQVLPAAGAAPPDCQQGGQP